MSSLADEHLRGILMDVLGLDVANAMTITSGMVQRLRHHLDGNATYAVNEYKKHTSGVRNQRKKEAKLSKRLRGAGGPPCPRCSQSGGEMPYCPADGSPHEHYDEGPEDPKSKSPANASSPEHTAALPESIGQTATTAQTPPSKCTRKAEKEAHTAAPLTKPRPLAAFGFVMNKRNVTAPTRPQFFHAFEDNDAARVMSSHWRDLQAADATHGSSMWGLGEFAVNSVTDPRASVGLHSFVTAFTTNAVAMGTTEHSGTDFDPETLLSVFNAESHEEFEPRPAFHGTHNSKTKDQWHALCCPDGRSVAPQSWIEAYEDSAEEWESEPEDAESCASAGNQSAADPDDDDDMDDFLDEDEAMGLLDEDDEEGLDIEQQQQLEQEIDQNRKKRRRKDQATTHSLVPRANFEAGDCCGLVIPLLDALPEGSPYTHLDSFLVGLLHERRPEKKQVNNLFFQTKLEMTAVVTPRCPGEPATLPASFGPDILQKLISILQGPSSRFCTNTGGVVHEFLKENPGISTRKDAAAAVKAVAKYVKGTWEVRPEYIQVVNASSAEPCS